MHDVCFGGLFGSPVLSIMITLVCAVGAIVVNRLVMKAVGGHKMYEGLTPGTTAAKGEAAEVDYTPATVAVRFEPPSDLAAFEAPVLEHNGSAQCGSRVRRAWLADLMVRGCLRITWLDSQWCLPERLVDPSELSKLEAAFVKSLVGKRGKRRIRMRGLRHLGNAEVKRVEQRLRGRRLLALDKLPRRPQAIKEVVQVTLFVASIPACFFFGGLAMMVLAGLAIYMASLPHRVNHRTAAGTAQWHQLQSFAEYLRKAEAKQLAWETDRGLLTRYLPWAVALGLDRQWSAVITGTITEAHADELDVSAKLVLEATETVCHLADDDR